MINKYKVDFRNKRGGFSEIKKALSTVLTFFVQINSKLKRVSQHTKSKHSKWNKIPKKRALPKLLNYNAAFSIKFFRALNFYKLHYNKQIIVLSTISLFVLTLVLGQFYAVNRGSRVGQAKEFVIENIKTPINNNLNNADKQGKIEKDVTQIIKNSSGELIYKTGRLYFMNEGNVLLDWNSNLQINKNFNYDIYAGTEDIEIVWDEIFNDNLLPVSGKNCIFNIFPYSDDIKVTSYVSSFKAGQCRAIFKASEQLNYKTFTIQAIVIDTLGKKFTNEKVLILN